MRQVFFILLISTFCFSQTNVIKIENSINQKTKILKENTRIK